MELYDHQIEAIDKLKNGNILVGGVGTGKSRTALGYFFFKVCDGSIGVNGKGKFRKPRTPRDLYIITTAKKRDSLEWEKETSSFCMCSGENKKVGINVTIDSWNNIKKYVKTVGAFFIFDEQRVVGYGAWTKAFLNITRKNQWILLSATPGDTWSDYIPVFIANGFYRNKSDFTKRHCVYSRFTKYPQIERYVDTGVLIRHRNDILIHMHYEKETVPHYITVPVTYDKNLYKTVWRDRFDPYDNEPIAETGKLFYLLRKVVNDDASRISAVYRIFGEHSRVIIFYNYTYELHRLRRLFSEYSDVAVGEWNGEVHSEVPKTDKWAYLVQYSAGAEGWNCIDTDTMIFYSQSYSYRMTKQAEGRIDRLNTSFTDLYYYKLKSTAPIDIAIARALSQKRNFNERSFKGR